MSSLTDAEKVDIRRFCGYPAYGSGAAGIESWRYFQAYGLLEFRLNNLSDPEIGIARRYLGTLTVLEGAVPAASDGLDTDQAAMWTRNKEELTDRCLDTDQAAMWTRNKEELTDRLQLFDEWRRRLCAFLGLPSGRSLSSGTATLIV